ncbi:MAG: FxsA family protein [Acidimicrobiia bacterium]|nr:FxsA family protein [Acidimicrobiia bacterium]
MIRLLLFIVLPVTELILLGVIGEAIGLGPTVLIVIATGVIGARLVARQGRMVWREIVTRLQAGQVPGSELAHGAMILVGGAFLVTPGVLTDAAGLLLMVPWFRELIRVRFLNTVRVVVL